MPRTAPSQVVPAESRTADGRDISVELLHGPLVGQLPQPFLEFELTLPAKVVFLTVLLCQLNGPLPAEDPFFKRLSFSSSYSLTGYPVSQCFPRHFQPCFDHCLFWQMTSGYLLKSSKKHCQLLDAKYTKFVEVALDHGCLHRSRQVCGISPWPTCEAVNTDRSEPRRSRSSNELSSDHRWPQLGCISFPQHFSGPV